MSDTQARMELGGMSSALGGKDSARVQDLQASQSPPSEGDPRDVSKGIQARLEEQGIEVDEGPLLAYGQSGPTKRSTGEDTI